MDLADRRASKISTFTALVERVQACRRCSTMEGRRRVLSELNGSLAAKVLFVAEAPGRFGGERTGIPLTSDRSGRNFERLLALAGLTRADIFVTNAVLCNPRDPVGRNRPPLSIEIARCQPHLADQLALIRSPFVVTLGLTALRSLEEIAPHGLVLRHDVGRPSTWQGRTLIPLYHPGAQAMLHRSFEIQAADYARLGQLVRAS